MCRLLNKLVIMTITNFFRGGDSLMDLGEGGERSNNCELIICFLRFSFLFAKIS